MKKLYWNNYYLYSMVALFILGGMLTLYARDKALDKSTRTGRFDGDIKKHETEGFVKSEISASEFGSLFERYSGKKVVIDNSTKKVKFSFAITASQNAPRSFDEIVATMETCAIQENVRLIFRGGGTYLLVKRDPVFKTGVSIPSGIIYSISNPLPEDDDQIVTYLMSFIGMEAEKVKSLVARSRVVTADYQSIAVVPGRNELIVTDKVSAIREMIQIQEKMR